MRLLKFPGELAWWLRGAVPLPYRPRLRVLLGMPSIRQRRWWRLSLPPVGFRYLVKSRAYFDHRLSRPVWPSVSYTETSAAVEPAANLAVAAIPRLEYSISIPPDRAEPAPVFHNNPVNSFNPRADIFGVAAADSRDSPLLQPEPVRGLKELIGLTSTPVASPSKFGFTAIPPVKIPPHSPLSKGGILNDSTTAASERRITAIKLSHNSPPLTISHNSPPLTKGGRGDFLGSQPSHAKPAPVFRNDKELIGLTSTPVAPPSKLGFTAIPPLQIPPHPLFSKGGILNEMVVVAGEEEILNEMAGTAGKGGILNEIVVVAGEGGILNEMAGAAGKGGILNEMAGVAGLKRNDSTTAVSLTNNSVNSDNSDSKRQRQLQKPSLKSTFTQKLKTMGFATLYRSNNSSPTNNSVNSVNSDHSDSERQRQPQKLNLKSTSISKGNLTSSSFSQNFPFNYLPYPRLERSESTTQTRQPNQPDLPANPRRSNPGKFFAELPASPRTRSSTPSGRGQIRLPANFWERHYLPRIHWHLFIR